MKRKEKSSSALTRVRNHLWIGVVLTTFALFFMFMGSVLLATDGEQFTLEHENARMEEFVSKKGTPLVRVVNLADSSLLCIIISDEDYYYISFAVHVGGASQWYIRPDAEEFIWWCD